MHDDTNIALKRLLSLAQNKLKKDKGTTLPANRITDYPFQNCERLHAFHEQLALAEKQGAIRIEWKKHYENSELQRIRLANIQSLAQFTGEILTSDAVIEMTRFLTDLNKPRWLEALLLEASEKWEVGKTWFGLNVSDQARIKQLINAINAIESMPDNLLMDYRQFGARYLDHSKRINDIKASLSGIYRKRLSVSEVSDKDVLAMLNIVSLSHPVFIRGPLIVSDGKEQSLSTDYRPYIGIPLACLKSIEITSVPKYIMTIENLSSFNEYTQNIDDEAIIIYSAGFPNSAIQDFYQRLTSQCQCPLFHWGDTDTHGFLILKTLQARAGKKVINPHLMDIGNGEPYTIAQLKKFKTMQPINTVVDTVLERIIKRERGMVEQESIKAIAPIVK